MGDSVSKTSDSEEIRVEATPGKIKSGNPQDTHDNDENVPDTDWTTPGASKVNNDYDDIYHENYGKK